MQNSDFLKAENAQHWWHPMGHPGALRANQPTIISEAEGVRIKDIDGNWMIDGVGGLWNVNLGYSCEPIKQAMADQLVKMPYYSGFAGTSNEPAIELSHELSQWFAEDGLNRSFFTSGGSDSVESCLRLARQYHKVRGEHGRTKFFSLKLGYHGTHFGGASVNGNNRFRTAYEPLLAGCFHMPCPYPYRNPFNESDPRKLAQLCLQMTEDEIKFQGPETIAAFIMEPIIGAGGIIVPHESFMPAIRELCDRYGILLIADEVITAFGRTGEWSGSRLWGVKPDMMATAKAITCGYFPFGAALMSEKVTDVFESNKTEAAAIRHGYTYSGHPVGAAAALACLKETKRLKVNESAKILGTQMYKGFQTLADKYSLVGDVRGGYGLMTALELVSDKTQKTPVDPSIGKLVGKVAAENGAMIRVAGHTIMVSPPLIATAAEVDTILSAIDSGLAAASNI
jgi:adenosylmethionine-8-amino-7-oxononanoate aminotransferase